MKKNLVDLDLEAVGDCGKMKVCGNCGGGMVTVENQEGETCTFCPECGEW